MRVSQRCALEKVGSEMAMALFYIRSSLSLRNLCMQMLRSHEFRFEKTASRDKPETAKTKREAIGYEQRRAMD
jgi:hypothetical protein